MLYFFLLLIISNNILLRHVTHKDGFTLYWPTGPAPEVFRVNQLNQPMENNITLKNWILH